MQIGIQMFDLHYKKKRYTIETRVILLYSDNRRGATKKKSC